jgi:nicotinamide-nucleotide amidase
MQFTSELENLVKQLAQCLREKQRKLCVAESCTGGLLGAALTAIPGSSQWFERGFITYANQAKQEMLGVPATTLQTHGAVSESTARAMVQGALQHSHADYAIAITGIAGPEGGSVQKPVGTVYIAWAGVDLATLCECQHFTGNRAAIRSQAVLFAVRKLCELL